MAILVALEGTTRTRTGQGHRGLGDEPLAKEAARGPALKAGAICEAEELAKRDGVNSAWLARHARGADKRGPGGAGEASADLGGGFALRTPSASCAGLGGRR